MARMSGYFGLGVQGLSKAHNLGAVLRTANAFGASFVFTIGSDPKRLHLGQTDTSRTWKSVPYFPFADEEDFRLPSGCQLVGVELTDDSIELPTFRHPKQCAYVLGPERGSLSPELQEACDHIVKIPTKFCINVSLAAALTLYDRTLCLGGYPDRPLMPGGPKLTDPKEWPARLR